MESLQVKDYMMLHPVVLLPNMTVAEAVEHLLYSKQSGGPVVDEKGKICGFLSEQDCIHKMLELSYYRERVCRIVDIMTTSVLTVNAHTSVVEVASKMLVEKPKMYPVVDDDGNLLGCISRSHVLGALNKQLTSEYAKIAV
jgi:predicted transcriptional regulator